MRPVLGYVAVAFRFIGGTCLLYNVYYTFGWVNFNARVTYNLHGAFFHLI